MRRLDARAHASEAALGVVPEDLRAGLRLLTGLPAFVRRPLTLAESRRLLAERLAEREADFLRVARAAVDTAASPYRALLRRAGCEEGDLARLLREDGLESTLGTLARAGMYVTVDEFKGRRPIVRGDLSLTVTPRAFMNPAAASHLSARTGGSRGEGAPIPVDLAWLRDRAVHLPVVFDALGWQGSRVAVWGMPGAAAMVRILEYAAAGLRPERWFSPVRPDSPGLHPRYRWSARIMRWASRAAGAALPRAEHVLPEDPAPVLDWIRAVLAAGGRPYLHTISSSAVRLAEAARPGARPSTASASRWAASRSPRRGSGWCGTPAPRRSRATGASSLGRSPSAAPRRRARTTSTCWASSTPSCRRGPRSPRASGADTFLVSSLRPSATLLLLNLSLGDGGVLGERRCGCPLDRPGWRTHLLGVRSAEKLTAAGMAFLDTDVVAILEEALPRRFGGGPADYQLVEDEAADGRPRLRLLVHPRVGPLDPASVVDAFLRSLGQSGRRPARRRARVAGRAAPRARAPAADDHVRRQDPASPRAALSRPAGRAGDILSAARRPDAPGTSRAAARAPHIMSTPRHFLDAITVEHTVFAPPFASLGTVPAARVPATERLASPDQGASPCPFS